jgi:phage gp29-like protein
VAEKPPRTFVTALPVAPAITKWTYEKILAALDEHELGQFSLSAELADAFGRDDRISACMRTRVQALLGKNGAEFSVQPSDRGGNKATAKKLAREVESRWWQLAPETVIGRILRDALFLGVSISRRSWTVSSEGEWIPTLHPRPMQHAWWDEATRRYQVNTTEGVRTIDPEDPDWFVFEIDGERSWMSGAVRALALPFLLRTFGWRDWARFCERHGLPILAIKEPIDASKEEKDAFFARMRKLGREAVLRLPQIDKDNGFGVEVVEAKDRGWETFQAFIGEVNVCIAICLLGQNLTTEAGGGGSSYAAGRVHLRVLALYSDADSERFSTGLRAGVVKPWQRYNRGGEEESAPWPHWDTKLPEDLGVRATTLVNASTALSTLLERGVRVDVAAFAASFRIPLLDGEPIEEPEEPEDDPDDDRDDKRVPAGG